MATLLQCTTCKRAVWDTDVDGSGNCCYCAAIPPQPTLPDPVDDETAA